LITPGFLYPLGTGDIHGRPWSISLKRRLPVTWCWWSVSKTTFVTPKITWQEYRFNVGRSIPLRVMMTMVIVPILSMSKGFDSRMPYCGSPVLQYCAVLGFTVYQFSLVYSVRFVTSTILLKSWITGLGKTKIHAYGQPAFHLTGSLFAADLKQCPFTFTLFYHWQWLLCQESWCWKFLSSITDSSLFLDNH